MFLKSPLVCLFFPKTIWQELRHKAIFLKFLLWLLQGCHQSLQCFYVSVSTVYRIREVYTQWRQRGRDIWMFTLSILHTMETAVKGHLEVYTQYSTHNEDSGEGTFGSLHSVFSVFPTKNSYAFCLIFRLNSKGLRRQHFKCYEII